MRFGDLVRKYREIKYVSAKQFYNSEKRSFNYFYYTQIEKCEVLPRQEICFELIHALNIDKRKALIAWVKSQMPDEESKAIFDDFNDLPVGNSPTNLNTERTLVLNRMQIDVLKRNPVFIELINFISCSPNNTSNSCIISEKFKMSEPSIIEMLNLLYDYGIVNRTSDKNTYTTHEWIFIPYTREFDDLKDKNFERAVSQFKKSSSFKFRNVLTIPLTSEQQKAVHEKFISLTNWLTTISSGNPKTDSIPFTIGFFGSERIMGEQYE